MSERTIEQYDPSADLAERHPGWTVKATELHGLGEVVDCDRRLILIDPHRYGHRYALAHSLAHLDLGHTSRNGGGAFTPQHEADAHWLATVRLDSARCRELEDAVSAGDWWDDVPVDGEPTVRM